MDYSQPGSPIHGILQARILEWVAVSFFKDDRISAFIRRGRNWNFLSLTAKGGHKIRQEGDHLQIRKKAFMDTKSVGNQTLWSWTSQPPELQEISICCLSHPIYGILLYQPQLTNRWRHKATPLTSLHLWIKDTKLLELKKFSLAWWKSGSITCSKAHTFMLERY